MIFRGTVPAASRVAVIERKHRNVEQLRWQAGSDRAPGRGVVMDMVLVLGFRVSEIFAIIHPVGSPTLMKSFLCKLEVVRGRPAWKPFRIVPLSRQDEVKKVTILIRNESVPAEDIVTWLGRYGQVMAPLKKNSIPRGSGWGAGWFPSN